MQRKQSFLLSTLLASACLLAACTPDAAPRKGLDVAVVQSPDRQFEAVVRKVNIDGSVMVSQPFQVLMRSLVLNPDHQVEVLGADRTDGVHLRWTHSNELEICYSKASIRRFTNTFVEAAPDPVRLVQAEIVLRKRNSLAECELAS